MPIYEYLCETCDHKFEVKQKFSDPPVESCAQCGKTVRKLISAPGILFKGTGWYVTDYSDKLKDPNQSTTNKGTEGSKDKSESGGESGSSKESTASGSKAASSDGGSSSTSKDSTPPPASTPSTASNTASSNTPPKSSHS